MKMSTRELVLLFLTLTIGLFGGTAILARPKLDEWQTLKKSQAETAEEITKNEYLIAQRDRWDARFNELKTKLPQYPVDQKMDIYWMSVMEKLAGDNALIIIKRQQKAEEKEGDVYELPIDCREWEGSLDAIVGFMVDLQKDGAMLDIREIAMKPNNDKILRGRFLLHCAYTREQSPDTGAATGPAPAPAPEPAAAPEPEPEPAGVDG